VARFVIILVLTGVVIGLLWPVLIRLRRGRIGDGVGIRRERISYFVLIAACVAVSFLISGVLWWFRM
jgi:hypothetical protein